MKRVLFSLGLFIALLASPFIVAAKFVVILLAAVIIDWSLLVLTHIHQDHENRH